MTVRTFFASLSLTRSPLLAAAFLGIGAGGCREWNPQVQPQTNGTQSISASPSPAKPKPSSLSAGVQPEIDVIAQIVVCSPLPDPARSEYKDCLFSAELSVIKPLSGPKTHRHVVAFFPGFLDRKLQPEALLKLGDIVRVHLTPFERTPRAIQGLQRSDAVDDFALTTWFCTASVKLPGSAESFRRATANEFLTDESDRPTAAAPVPAAYPRSERAFALRKRAIEADRRRIEADLSRNGGSWKEWENRLRAFHRDLQRQLAASPTGRLDSGRFHFRSMTEHSYRELCDDMDAGKPGPLPMLSNLNEQLRLRGIDLIVAPIPHKEEVHADEFSSLAPADGIFLANRLRFLRQLLDADIEVIDLVPALRQARQEFDWLFYDADDFHPADGAIQVAAREVARRLDRYDFRKAAGHVPLQSRLKVDEFTITDAAGGMKIGARYPATVVELLGGGRILRENAECNSPLVLMGDSVTIVPPQFGDQATIRAHLAHLTGIIPDHLTSMGGSAQAMRHLAREGGHFLSDRAALVFVFAPTRLFGYLSKTGEGAGWDLVNLPPLRFE